MERRNAETVHRPAEFLSIHVLCAVTLRPGAAEVHSRAVTVLRHDKPSEAQRKFYDVIRRIPHGRVATYGQVAALAGLPRRARMVGQALRSTPEGLEIPWYRVVNAQGRVSPRGGIGWEEGYQRHLLEEEGVVFSKSGRIDLDRFGWDRAPSRVQKSRGSQRLPAVEGVAGSRACRSRSRRLNQRERCCGGAVRPGLRVHPARWPASGCGRRPPRRRRRAPRRRRPPRGCLRCCVECAQTPGEAVGLQLEPHRELRWPDPGPACCSLLDLAADAEQVLHVVADLVGDHVGLGEVAGRAEAVAQLLVEAEVDVDLLVGRAVERPHRGLRRSRSRSASPSRKSTSLACW